MQPETALTRNIRLALNRTGRVRLVRNNVGVDVSKGVRYGLGVGSPDLVGVLPTGQLFCLEIKMPGRSLDPDQRTWWRASARWNVLGGVAHSIDEALALLDQAERSAMGAH